MEAVWSNGCLGDCSLPYSHGLVPLGEVLKSFLKAQLEFAWSQLFKCPCLLPVSSPSDFQKSFVHHTYLKTFIESFIELGGRWDAWDTDEYRKDFCLLKPHESQQPTSVRAERKLKWKEGCLFGVCPTCALKLSYLRINQLCSARCLYSRNPGSCQLSRYIMRHWTPEEFSKRHCQS